MDREDAKKRMHAVAMEAVDGNAKAATDLVKEAYQDALSMRPEEMRNIHAQGSMEV